VSETGLTGSWSELLAQVPPERRDIYHEEDYHRLYSAEDGEATCFYHRDGDRVFLLPFVKRPIPGSERSWDFESAYGYGGPVTNCAEAGFLNTAVSAFYELCRESGIVCGLIRFHPILANQALLRPDERFSIENDRMTVAIDLRRGAESIWSEEIHSKNRNSIRKAQEHGLEFVVDESFDGIGMFQRLYEQTMQRRGADGSYYFTTNYYQELHRLLRQRSCICFVRDGEKIIAGAILFWGAVYGHYHLSGSDESSLSLSPNNFMLYHAALFLMKKGIVLFHLGGGSTRDPDNSLFQFKKRFSRSTYQFCIGKPVFLPAAYRTLCEDWQRRNPARAGQYSGYLMKYRR
jgi:serine/alanine adding enzyme